MKTNKKYQISNVVSDFAPNWNFQQVLKKHFSKANFFEAMWALQMTQNSSKEVEEQT